MSVEDSESRRFELNIRLSFSQADVGADVEFLSGFSKSLQLSVSRIVFIASLFRNILAGISEIHVLNGNFAFPLA